MVRKNNFILLHVRRHAGELDWILPFLYKISKKYKLITVFNDFSAFESLKNNYELFSLWKKINYSFYIQPKNKIYLRFLSKMLLFISKFKIYKEIIEKLNFYTLVRIYDFDFFLNKEFTNWNKIKIVILTNNNFSFIPNYIKLKNQKLKIIRYPETTWPKPKKQLKKIKVSEINLNLLADYYLLNNAKDSLFFGNSMNGKIKKKIIIAGYLKYQKWWLNKILSTNLKKIYNRFTILVVTRPARNIKKGDFSEESYKYLVSSIMQISNKIKNSLVIFKTHPNNKGSENELLKSTLSSFSKDKWKIQNIHTLKLAKKANICISFQTSACMDCLAVKKFVVEFWLNKSDYNFLIKKNNKHISVFKYFGLVESVDSKKKLEELILKFKKNKFSGLLKKQIINFSKLNKDNININKFIKLIETDV